MEEPSTSVVSSLRSRNPYIYLVGQPCMSIMGTKLPSHRQVLQLLFFQTHLAKSRRKVASVNDSASLVTDSVLIFWRQAAIPTKKVQHVKDKVLALHEQWNKLQRNEKKGGAAQKKKEKEFSDKLDDLFDIAHANALTMMSSAEDVEFLKAQRRKGRPGCMLGVDEVLYRQEQNRAEREEQEEMRRNRASHDKPKTVTGWRGYFRRKFVFLLISFFQLKVKDSRPPNRVKYRRQEKTKGHMVLVTLIQLSNRESSVRRRIHEVTSNASTKSLYLLSITPK